MTPIRSAGAKRAAQSGFTLTEVLVVTAILGILAGLALPAYRDYVRRGSIPEATAALSDYRIKMEQYYQDHRNYGSDGKCANDSPAPAWKDFSPAGKKNFDYGCETLEDGQDYKLTATGKSASVVAGHTYQLTSSASKTTAFKGETVDKNCWVVRGDEC
ncbi:prepilin-type N-terminal cleavage/methylation domain-containing protein [Mitsuaria sp. WAJ17]|uniref:type IV pilin protein n=1 Tax=Mitsuaria sp. WAJ17 TaxID=2761452 RepID=UPI0015FECAC2|nr:type IV pilin protein [Mitsuaria sp. WAJ17]MBB2484890.1 prepilin-type N-terminal cleavage/methylation domain-containing protein [Mitsuaria sp. WAJ17]